MERDSGSTQIHETRETKFLERFQFHLVKIKPIFSLSSVSSNFHTSKMDDAPAIPWPPNSGTNTGGSGIGEILTPLLARGEGDRSRGLIRMWGLRGAARFLRRAGRRRVLREPSMRVREAAAEQLEVRQNDWAYSWPVVVLDILWNLSFIAVAAAVLMVSGSEFPEAPLRIWIAGYALQCLFHIVCVCLEYHRRLRGPMGEDRGENVGDGGSFEAQLNEEEKTRYDNLM